LAAANTEDVLLVLYCMVYMALCIVGCCRCRQRTITSCLSRGRIRRSRTHLSSVTCLNSSTSRSV